MFKKIITAAFAIVATAVVSSQTVQAASDTGITTNGTITLSPGGAITLDKAPYLDFGTKPISTTATTYSTSGSAPIQVTNPGFASGWSVSVAATAFTTGKYDLKGAELKVNALTITPDDPDNKSEYPNSVKSTIEPGGDSVKVLSADAATADADAAGVGVWNDSWDKVTLSVPAGNVAGDYKASLNWTLTDAP